MSVRKEYDPTNKAIVFVENGIFAKAGVENLQAQGKPILKVFANVDGKEVEIPLYFDMIYDEAIGGYTTDYKLSKTGSKMLKCKKIVPKDSWKITKDFGKAVASVTETTETEEFEDDIPF